MDYIRDTRQRVFVMNDEYLNGYAKVCGIYATGVYLSLCRHAGKDQTCFPSKRLIAEELGISERQVYDSLMVLQRMNLIKINRQDRLTNGSFRNNTYVLLDKTVWMKKPQAYCADGISGHPPQAYQRNHRRHTVPTKDTHKKKGTHNKGKADFLNSDRIPESDEARDIIKQLRGSINETR